MLPPVESDFAKAQTSSKLQSKQQTGGRGGIGPLKTPNLNPDSRPRTCALIPSGRRRQVKDKSPFCLQPHPLLVETAAAALGIPDPPNLGIMRDKTSSASPLHDAHKGSKIDPSLAPFPSLPFPSLLSAHPFICIRPSSAYLFIIFLSCVST